MIDEDTISVYISDAVDVLRSPDGDFDDAVNAHISIGVDSEKDDQLVMEMHYEDVSVSFLVSVKVIDVKQ